MNMCRIISITVFLFLLSPPIVFAVDRLDNPSMGGGEGVAERPDRPDRPPREDKPEKAASTPVPSGHPTPAPTATPEDHSGLRQAEGHEAVKSGMDASDPLEKSGGSTGAKSVPPGNPNKPPYEKER